VQSVIDALRRRIMIDDYYEYFEEEPEPEPQPDPIAVAASKDLRKFFSRRRMPYYIGQLECMFEKKYFHWVTHSAVRLLINDGFLKESNTVIAGNPMTFVHRPNLSAAVLNKHINAAKRLLKIVWSEEMAKMRGTHLEALVRAELRANGFLIVGIHTKQYRDKEWTETGHDLDFIAELGNGEAIGLEVKNTLPYIPKKEFELKLKMCEYFGVRPVFAARWLPKNYIYQAYRKRGFGWLFEYQAYPLGHERLCEQLQKRLSFPVMVMTELPPKSQELFSKWVKKLKGVS